MPSLSDIFGGSFRPDEHEPAKDFEVLAPGKYVVQIEEAELKETKAGNGHYLRIQMVIVDGDHKNRKLWDNINLDNPEPTCVRIGKGELSALSRALGLKELDDEAQLVNGIVVAHVKVKNNQNEVRTYSAVYESAVEGSFIPQQSAPPTTPVQQPTQPTPAGPAVTPPPPWAR